ncbi:MAG: hypothetical protein C4536_01725 [Actinobacteria bacterium]|nr:MAG: hypothetical protein C4536_01725 [Actinomycetota bacterium]
MQKKPAQGLFINSSYRRAGLLKTLLHGFRHGRVQEEPRDRPYELCDQVTPSPDAWKAGEKGGETSIKKAASL